MPILELDAIRLKGHRAHPVGQRLWREWCFLRVALRRFRINFLLLGVLLVGGGLLFRLLEPEKQHTLPRAIYYTWVLIFGQPPEEFPSSIVLQTMFFLVPLLGIAVILEGLVDFTLLLRDRRRSERSWCKVMAGALSNHIILVGLGKLGFRTYRLLRQLGETVVVIECDAENQFLEDIRSDGNPLFVGDARREAFLNDANVSAARSIILATDRDLVNLEVALDARRINPQIRVVLRMFDQNMADKICEGFNIQVAMSQSALSAPAFVTAALGGAIVNSLVIGDQLVVIERWEVAADSPLCGTSVADVMAAYGVVLVQQRDRQGQTRLMPPPTVRISAGDELLVQGPFESLSRQALMAVGSGPELTHRVRQAGKRV